MRSLFGLLAGATLLLLVSCTADLQETIIPHVGDVIELTAYADNGVATKTGIVDNGNGGKNVVWKSGNAISLFFNAGDNGGNKFTTTDSGPVATFKGSISAISGSLSETGGKAYFWGLYPYNASVSCDGTCITTTLSSTQLAYQGDVADDLLVTVGRSRDLAMSFKNACAVIGFTLCQDNISKVTFKGNNNEKVAGEFKASFSSSDQLSVTPTSNAVKSIEITPAESSTFVKGKTYYFAILPQHFQSGYTLTFTRNDGHFATYERTTAFNFDISYFYTMTDKDNGLLFAVNPANCHIVNTTKDLYFRATKGNSSTSVGDVSCVEVLWESFSSDVQPNVGDVISDVAINGSIIHVRTGEYEGNAVVAAKDSEGTILWSWHIWVTNDEIKEALYSNNAGIMMDRNVGSLKKSGNWGYYNDSGLLYQWGRKDPFLSECKNMYDYMASTITWPDEVAKETGGSVEYAIQHPTTKVYVRSYSYGSSYDGDWLINSDNTLWGEEKTIYDPCPSGWKLPKGGPQGIWAIAGFPSGSYSSGSYTSYSGGTGYPDTYDYGGDDDRGKGLYWSYLTYNGSSSYALRFSWYRDDDAPDYYSSSPSGFDNKAELGAVRCVRDQ